MMLALWAGVAVACIVAGGYTVYNNMRHTERERGWADHSEAVLANLQDAQRRLDRAGFNLQMYAATGDRARLQQGRSVLSGMDVGLVQLQSLVADNASQRHHEQDLARDLLRLMATLPQGGDSEDRAVLAARNDIGIMQAEETGLLAQRTEISKQSLNRSFDLSAIFLGLSLAIVLTLFLFLFRDVLRRRVDEENLMNTQRELEGTVRKLTERADEATLLTNARDELQLCTDAQSAHESTCRHMQRLLPGTNGATLVINNSRRMVEIVSSWGVNSAMQDGFSPDACCGLRGGKARWRRPGRSELDCLHFTSAPPESYLCVPLAAHGETQGFVFVGCPTAETLALAEARTPLILELVELASLAIASLNLRTKLELQSIRDGLTGLFNRRFMEIALERELHRATRRKTSLAVMMLDVDHFKRLNDTFGHEAGDVVLRDVAECLQRSLRVEDTVCRYGGEEFVVIMPEASEEPALRRAEGIREAVSQLRTIFRGELIGPVTVSVGVAVSLDGADDASNLIRTADEALYRAKREGRNRVVMETAEVVLAGA